MWTEGVLLLGLGYSAVCAFVGDFVVENIDDGDNVTISSSDDIATSPELEERYKYLNRYKRDESATNVVFEQELEGIFGRLISKHKREVGSSKRLTIELGIFTDIALFNYVKERYPDEDHDNIDEVITDLVLAVVSSVQLYLNHKSLDQEFQLEIVHMDIMDDQDVPDLASNGDIRAYLDTFCKYQRKKMVNNLAWDHAMLLTGLDLYTTPGYDKGSSGMAYLSGMCSRQASCTISEARSLGSTALIVAHELAHNLGVDHDGQGANTGCDSDDFIMGPKLSPGATQWSDCSNRQMQQFITRFGGCLLNPPVKTYSGWQHSDLGLPGHRFDGNAQCHLLYGSGWSHYTGLVRNKVVSSCEAIWCRNTIYLRSPNAAALQGTKCGKGKHCIGGECVRKTGTTLATHQVTTMTEQTTTIAKRTKQTNSQVFFPSRSMGICKFFMQFGIKLDYCP